LVRRYPLSLTSSPISSLTSSPISALTSSPISSSPISSSLTSSLTSLTSSPISALTLLLLLLLPKGGADLTPYTLCDDEIKNFHKQYKQICDKYDSDLYRKLKVNCDKYFYIPARLEHRGTGGIFFDDLSELSEKGAETAMEFTKQVCETFMPSYLPLTKLNSLPYSEEQRNFQLLRRGRYIEFNFLYDRGVKFGIVPGGRIEAVMISCPPLVRWIYNYVAKEGSEEARLISILKNPIDWV